MLFASHCRCLQLQLGSEYAMDTNLRDAIQRAVPSEPFAIFLPLAPARTSLEIQEACSRAISVMEDHSRQKFTKSATVNPSSSSDPSTGVKVHNRAGFRQRKSLLLAIDRVMAPPGFCFGSNFRESYNRDRPGMAQRRFGRDNRPRPLSLISEPLMD